MDASSALRPTNSGAAQPLLSRVKAFEEFAHRVADEAAVHPFDEQMNRMFMTGYRWDLVALYGALHDSSEVEHLRRVMDAAIDAKLQLMYLTDLGLGMSDVEWFLEQSGQRAVKPSLYRLRSLAQLQDEIGKIRVFWERFMNLVYALETGGVLHGSKSVKKKFFREIAVHEHWKWLAPYESEIERFDARFRTAEFHKSSVLRKQIFEPDPDLHSDVLALLNAAMNQLWDNVILIASGERDPTRFNYGLVHSKASMGPFADAPEAADDTASAEPS